MVQSHLDIFPTNYLLLNIYDKQSVTDMYRIAYSHIHFILSRAYY